jgi:peptide/nickel transport system permease protein
MFQSVNFQELSAPAITSFLLIIAAEMGDKSQLVCMTLAARHRAMPVAFGAIFAFAFLNTLAVVFGVAIADWLPPYVVSGTVALLFLFFGIQSLQATEESDEGEIVIEKSSHNIFFTTFLLIAMAEFGDKTQLAVVALSSTEIPLAVWIGSTIALAFTSILGCIAGRTILQKMSLVWLHKISGGFFISLAILAGYRTVSSVCQIVILGTDALIFGLLFSVVGIFYFLHGKAHLKRPLTVLKQSSTGMASLIILMCFMTIGVLDSIHFKPQTKDNEIISVLDYWASSLREHGEKTYSEPFATTLYNKEMIVQPDGSMRWDYPRLTFGGKHLANETEKMTDIFEKTTTGFLIGGGIFLLLIFTLNIKSKFTFFALITLSSTLIYLSNFYHVFGTDKVGEDVFYQTIKSIRTGLVLGTLTTMILLPLSLVLGILAGFFRGWLDDVIQFLYTTLNSIPSVLLIGASVLMVQVYMANHESDFTSLIIRADMRLLFLCLILGMTSWTGLCRLLRAETLKLREMEYVQAAYSLGVRQHTILIRHILPNVMHIVLISIVLDFSSLVLAEAALSYINIGVDSSTYSWGNMINGARLEMAREPIVWWSLTAAFLFMFALVLAANLFAETVQTAFDPRRGQ